MDVLNSQNNLLQKINNPDDLKLLKSKECKTLAQEIRNRIISVVSENGGHLASNLGVVELTMALHRVFTTPEDIIVWDVGHQCYTHKILTGRNSEMNTIRKRGGLSGFPKRSESSHDFMDTGHASTSISAALGMLESRKLQGKKGKVIAVIGDGSLTGGMAFEAMNHAGHLKDDLIIILNDNDMSIGRNIGALSSRPRPGRISSTISRFSILPIYQKSKAVISFIYSHIPFVGKYLTMLRYRFKKAIKASFLKENIFGDLGFEYVGPILGHNIKSMEKVFRRVKKLKRPVVVQILTQKGRGYSYAEGDPSSYHGVGSFSVTDGKFDKKSTLTFTECFSSTMVKLGHKDPLISAVTAAMVKGTGLSEFQNIFPKRIFDVAIAEQHALTFAAGLAAEGMKPIVAIYSTFMQRAVDQVIHDIAIPNLPVIIVMSRSGYVAEDGETHQGLYDIPIFRSIPNLQLLSPSGAVDLPLMMSYALEQKSPVLIRLPKAACSFSSLLNRPIKKGCGIFIHKKKNPIVLVSFGGTFDVVEDASNILAREGILTDHYNLRFAKPLSEKVLANDLSVYQNVIFVEDGAKEGGIGERLALILIKKRPSLIFHHLAAPDEFLSQATRAQLMQDAGIDCDSIVSLVKSI